MTVLGRYHDSTRIHDTAQSQVPVPGIIEIIVSWPYDYDSTKIHNRLSRPSIMVLKDFFIEAVSDTCINRRRACVGRLCSPRR